MRRTPIGVLVLTFVFSCGAYLCAAEFFLSCGDTCGASDSGTASGDGSSSVHTSNGSAGFTVGVPSFTDLGVDDADDLRFDVEIGSNLPHPPVAPDDPIDPVTCILNSNEVPLYSGCDYDYNQVQIERLRFFVMTDSFICNLTFSPCRTVGSVSLGGTNNQTLKKVIFSADVVVPPGLTLPEGGQTTLQLSRLQATILDLWRYVVGAIDPGADFYVGFAITIKPVDPDLTDTIVPHFRQSGIRIVTIEPRVEN